MAWAPSEYHEYSRFLARQMVRLDAIPWYRRKISISLRHLQTEEGRRLCNARLPFVLQFLDQLESELERYGD
jgi:hypothetical protein